MIHEEVHKVNFLICERMNCHVPVLVEKAREAGALVEVHPQLAVLFGDLDDRFSPPHPRVNVERESREEQGRDGTNDLEETSPTLDVP